MTGTITGIHRKKQGNGAEFERVTFSIDSEEPGGKPKWAKTDLCRRFRNYKFWEGRVIVGARFSGLRMKDEQTVDADQAPKFLGLAPEPPKPLPDPQMTML